MKMNILKQIASGVVLSAVVCGASQVFADALAGVEGDYAPKNTFGVYKAGSRKAYMALLGSVPGFTIIIR